MRLAEAYVKGNNVRFVIQREREDRGRSLLLLAQAVLTIRTHRSNTCGSPTRSSTWSRSSRTISRAASGAAGAADSEATTADGAATGAAEEEGRGAAAAAAEALEEAWPTKAVLDVDDGSWQTTRRKKMKKRRPQR